MSCTVRVLRQWHRLPETWWMCWPFQGEPGSDSEQLDLAVDGQHGGVGSHRKPTCIQAAHQHGVHDVHYLLDTSHTTDWRSPGNPSTPSGCKMKSEETQNIIYNTTRMHTMPLKNTHRMDAIST